MNVDPKALINMLREKALRQQDEVDELHQWADSLEESLNDLTPEQEARIGHASGCSSGACE